MDGHKRAQSGQRASVFDGRCAKNLKPAAVPHIDSPQLGLSADRGNRRSGASPSPYPGIEFGAAKLALSITAILPGFWETVARSTHDFSLLCRFNHCLLGKARRGLHPPSPRVLFRIFQFSFRPSHMKNFPRS